MNMNYENDYRTQDPASAPTVFLGEGDEEHPLPFVYEVCSVCQGEGTHVNPSIDCDGLTHEDFDADPEFQDNYFRGDYDITCNNCGGKRVEKVPDFRAMSQEMRDAWKEQQEEKNDY